MQNSKKSAQFILLAGLSALCQIASAQVSAMPDMGKLTATGGVRKKGSGPTFQHFKIYPC